MLQAALRQQMAMQQRQEAMRLLSTLTPEQREQLGRLPPVQQASYASIRNLFSVCYSSQLDAHTYSCVA